MADQHAAERKQLERQLLMGQSEEAAGSRLLRSDCSPDPLFALSAHLLVVLAII